MCGGVRARGARLFAVGLLAAVLGVVPRSAAGADPYRSVSQAVGEGLLALFPAVEGYVVSASGGEAYVDLAQKDLVRPGMELQVYRPGAEMIHPVTRQVLGAYEKDLGVLNLTEVREKYSRGALDAAGAAAGIVPGDRVRISARRLRTLLHVSGAAAGIEIGPLAQALLARGEQSGRFAMIDEPAWAPSLAALGAAWESVRADQALLRRLGELAAAELLLIARIEPGTVTRLAVEVRSLRTGTMLGELSERWPAPAPVSSPAGPVTPPAATVAAAPSEPKTTPAPAAAPAPSAPAASAAPASAAPVAAAAAAAVPAPSPDEYVQRELAAPAKSLAAGNILGEGRVEVLLTDGARLSLYRWEKEALAWRWDEDGKGGRRVLSLDAADIDGDGRAEVLVTVLVHGRITSELRRWQDGALRVAATIDGVYLRTASPSVSPTLLLGQRSGIDTVLDGRVEQYRLANGTFERLEGTALPREVGIFGLALAPGNAPAMIYSVGRGGHITGMTPAGQVTWSSPRPYGGYPAPVAASDLFGIRGGLDEQGFDEEARAFQGRLLAERTAAGVWLAVPRNFSDSLILLPRQREFSQGEVVILGGVPESPEELGRSRAFDGYVSDLARADVDGDGKAEILFVVIRSGGLLRGDRGKLVAWRPAGVLERAK
jgi:hypothetical protein